MIQLFKKKMRKILNKELLAMNNKDEITDGLNARLGSIWGQPARIYGLAKLHKQDTPLRPVLFLPGSFY